MHLCILHIQGTVSVVHLPNLLGAGFEKSSINRTSQCSCQDAHDFARAHELQENVDGLFFIQDRIIIAKAHELQEKDNDLLFQ